MFADHKLARTRWHLCSRQHARKIAARLEALGHRVFFYEPEQGGHVGADFRQPAHM
jgi:prolyl oligopeptidase PreP (S9A serine peptidase family)